MSKFVAGLLALDGTLLLAHQVRTTERD